MVNKRLETSAFWTLDKLSKEADLKIRIRRFVHCIVDRSLWQNNNKLIWVQLGIVAKKHLWPYLGKAGLTKIALKRFSVVMHFQRIYNALTSISNAFWNIANAFQRKRNALQIHFKKHFQNVVNALANPCQRIEWNRNGPFGIVHGTAAIRYYEFFTMNC